jgi:integrase
MHSIFEGIGIHGAKKGQRLAYPHDYVQAHFLAERAFEDLNPEARRIIYLLIETGLRPSEACNLTKETIHLDCAIPHVRVVPDGRELKTDQSQRIIPLVGVALLAMQAQPNGFPRYRDKADSFSALANKALTARRLRPLPGQSVYSLRHTFQDRLTALELPERITKDLMGHILDVPRYGTGPSLEHKARILTSIAFRAPSSV